MYTRGEKKALIKEFWKSFDDFCNLDPMLAWRKKKWMLHRTGINNIDLKFEAGRQATRVILELNHRDEDRRLEMWERILKFKSVLEQQLEGELHYHLIYIRESGEEVSRIYTELKDVDVHRKLDWPRMFSFMADKMDILQQNFLDFSDFIKDENWEE